MARYFFIIGAPKAATTSFWNLLMQHPEISVCMPKEPEFFSHDENYSKGWSWYDTFFRDKENAPVRADISPAYSATHFCPDAPKRIASHLPDARIVYMVRHPLERIESNFFQGLYTKKPMPSSFNRAVKEYPPLLKYSLYWSCISNYLKHFSEEQFRVLFFEDFKSGPEQFMSELCDFIGVDRSFEFRDVSKPKNPSKGHMKDGPLLNATRNLPGRELLKSLIPDRLRGIMKKRLQVRISGDIKWDEETKEWALEQLRDEAMATLDYAGKPRDFWEL